MVGQLIGVHACDGTQVVHMPTRNSKQKQQEPSDLLSVSQAAALLSVHPDTIRRWAAGGRLRGYRIGPRRDRRFHRSEVLRLMTSG